MIPLILSAVLTIAHCDLDHDLSKFKPTNADFVGLIDVDWHARRSGRDAQAEVLGAKYGYVSSYTTDHFLFETPDEQHGVAILSHEAPKSRLIRKLPSTGKGKVFFACEFTDFRQRMTLARKRLIARRIHAAPLPTEVKR